MPPKKAIRFDHHFDHGVFHAEKITGLAEDRRPERPAYRIVVSVNGEVCGCQTLLAGNAPMSDYLSGNLHNYQHPQAAIDDALSKLPQVTM